MKLDWATDIANDITLVSVRLRNERAVPRRVRLRNRLDGTVLPPRCQKEPECGWDREGVTRVIPAGERLALGYASPAPPRDPPVELAEVGPPEGSASETPAGMSASQPSAEISASEPPTEMSVSQPSAEMSTPGPAAVSEAIRRLGDARPPRAVLGAGLESRHADPAAEATTDGGSELVGATERATSSALPDNDEKRVMGDLPAGADELLGPYRRRVETVEALNVTSVPEATAVLDANGGIAGVQRTGAELTADAAALRALAAEATALAARATAATRPTDLLRRLA